MKMLVLERGLEPLRFITTRSLVLCMTIDYQCKMIFNPSRLPIGYQTCKSKPFLNAFLQV
ncbi:hypothetical protein EAJ17_07220 [Akkermansia sp. aa_0143]|nr:hypothetical protein EAJ17_07220 [Akkermansia sp. aa_0143]